MLALVLSLALAAEGNNVTNATSARLTSHITGRPLVIGPFWAVASPVCAALGAGNSVGNWWCLNGDGTMAAGSAVTLAGVNSPAVLSHIVCPNGASCTEATDTLLNPNGAAGIQQYYATASTVAAPTGSFTTCALGSNANVAHASLATPAEVGWVMYGDLAGTNTWSSTTTAGGGNGNTVNCSTGCGANVHSLVPTAVRINYLQCSVFEASTRTRSCTYPPGGPLTCVSSAHAVAAVANTARKWVVGMRSAGSTTNQGWMRGAFFTEKALSDAEMTAIGAAALIGKPAGMTFSRASKAACCTGSQCAEVPEDIPCIMGGAAVSETAKKNDSVSSGVEQIGAGWADDSSICAATADTPASTSSGSSAYTPCGTWVADYIVIPSCTGTTGSNKYTRMYQSIGFTAPTAGSKTVSFWTRGSGSVFVAAIDGAGAVLGSAGVSPSSSWARSSLTFSNVAGAPTIMIGCLPHYDTTLGCTGGEFYFTNFSAENDSMTSFVPKASGTTTRAATSCSGTGC